MANHIAEYNKLHFNQAKDTPLSTYKSSFTNLKSIEKSPTVLPYTTQIDTDILNNKAYLQQRFESNIRKPPSDEKKVEVTEEEWMIKMKKWKERTTTSPSGLHLGHHKSLFSPHKYTHDDPCAEKAELDNKQSSILTAYMTLYNMVLKKSIVLSRWKTVHSIVLFKDSTNKYLHQIRNIHIYEADYNLLLKLKWGEVVEAAEQNSLLHASQFGSRKSRRSVDPIISEIMMQESSRLNITPFIQVNYDAQACYDRIIPEDAFQLSYKYGVNNKIIELVQKVMSETKYFIKIGNTITDQFYTITLEYKLFGTGQGSGFSPHIWTLLSNELFQIYSEYSSGFEFNPPYSTSSSQIHITAYVDNINMHHTFSSKSTISNMIQKASVWAQRWNDLLYISGGQLPSTKCNFYAVGSK
jgi:Reverse transcriptase (RNA-dependent DNA polymerase)